MPANPLSGLLNRHRSIRCCKPDPVDAETAEAVCADWFRTRQWLRLRGARDNFDNLLGYHVAAFDAMIVPQNVCLGFDAAGITSLAQFYTSAAKYDPDVLRRDSAELRALLEAKRFLP